MANVLLVAAALLAVFAAAVAATGGFELRVAGVRIRSHAWVRPAAAAVALMGVGGLIARERLAAASRLIWTVLDRPTTARLIALAAAAWILTAGIRFGTFAAGGSDSYGYVSQAALLANGRLTDTVPLDPSFDWPVAHSTLTPLGYVAATEPGVIAPSYPPGLPLLLAGPWLVSPSTVYFVVPLLGALAVFLCYRLGRLFDDPLAGGLAGVLLSVSPAFLIHAMQPMSDVPAAACWLAAFTLSLAGTSRRSALAGAVTSFAILIRPNLAPLGIVPMALTVWLAADRRAQLRNVALFVAACVPALAGLAWIQDVRYGSPLASGYGSLDELFSMRHVGVNLEQYATWLTDTQTPFVWMCALAPFMAAGTRRSRAAVWFALAFCAIVFALYLPYVAFNRNEWTYLRFLLPALPLALLLASRVVLAVVRRLPRVARAPLTAVLFAATAVYCVHAADRRRVFELREFEQRYTEAGEFVGQRLPANAIVLAAQHSGSVRLYGARPILRWDLLQPDGLDRALAALRAKGLAPFMVVDPWEWRAFESRFGPAGQKTAGTARLIRVVAGVQIYAFD